MPWEQLLSIAAEARAYKESERAEPPMACPYDGEPLDAAPGGGVFCPLGNYRWPRDRRIV